MACNWGDYKLMAKALYRRVKVDKDRWQYVSMVHSLVVWCNEPYWIQPTPRARAWHACMLHHRFIWTCSVDSTGVARRCEYKYCLVVWSCHALALASYQTCYICHVLYISLCSNLLLIHIFFCFKLYSIYSVAYNIKHCFTHLYVWSFDHSLSYLANACNYVEI
jgi:hypothetical protein